MSINSIIFQYAAIGDYLFLILIIVASIIQAITQNKKKKALQELEHKRMDQPDSQIADTIEKRPETMKGYKAPVHDIFDSIEQFLIPEVEDEKYNWDDDYAEASTKEKSLKDEVITSDSAEENLSLNTKKKYIIPLSQKPVNIPKVSYKSKIREGFTMRKAVVYSEILNRKYT